MKRNLQTSVGAILLAAVLACNSEEKTKPADGTAPGSPAVQNVNGNVPDATNSVNLDPTMPTDSSGLKKDTSQQ